MSDALEEIERLLPQLPAAAERQKLGHQLDVAAEKLRSGAQEAERLKALVDLASLLGLDGLEQREELDDAREEARKVGTALATAEEAEHLRQAIDRYERDFLPVLKALHRSLVNRWDLVANREFRPLVQVGDMLGWLDQGSTLGRDLAACGKDATNYKPGASAAEFLNQVGNLIARRDLLQEQRRAIYGEGAVAVFVNALAVNQARLDMVTPEVRDWLEAHGASGRLRVLI